MAKREKGFELRAHYCPVCGKEFFPGPEWVYKNIDGVFCSWHCLRANERQVTEEIKALRNQPVQCLSSDGKVVGEYDCAEDAANTLGLPSDAIRYACYRERKYKNHIWRYKKDEVSEM
jgi:hypothetical protein